jgi:hypothetical protein
LPPAPRRPIELSVARSLFALAKQLGAADDDEAREVVAQSVELFRRQVGARPSEVSAALILLALLEDDERALTALKEASELVETSHADDPNPEVARQNVETSATVVWSEP